MVEESRNRELFARLHLITGEIFSELLALVESSQHLETGLSLVRELGSGILTVGATSGLVMVAVLQKDFTRARALLVQLLPGEYPKGDEPPPLRRCWSACAELELAQGNPHRALEIVERLLAATPNLAQYGPHAVPRLSQLRGRALAALGQMQEAETEMQGALQVALNHGWRPLLWRLHADLGRVYRAMGRRNDAQREFSSARIIIQELANEIPEGAIPLLTGGSKTFLRETFLQQALTAVPAIQAPTRLQAAKKEFGGLTAREREIAALIARGKSNREIANELVITENTTERHVANILSKLGFSSRAQIAVWAAEKGLGR